VTGRLGGRELTALAWRGLRGGLLACATLLATACGGGGGADAPQAGASWLVLGSSTAAGVGASAGMGWAARLDAALRDRGARVDNRARSGASTYQALPADAPRPTTRPATDPAQDVAVALLTRPRVMVLAFPSNDAMLGYGAAETTANLLLMHERARAAGTAVLVLSSQPRDDAPAAAREAMIASDRSLSAALGACFVDLRADLSGPDGNIASAYAAGDGVHLNNDGHGIVFQRLWEAAGSGRCAGTR